MTVAGSPEDAAAVRAAERNRAFYDPLWATADLIEPDRFNSWPLVQSMVSPGTRCLEVACGLRPRLPLDGTHFVDVSAPALAEFARRGLSATRASLTALPFPTECFDVVCALDVVEHLSDGERALDELVRVMAIGAVLLLSVPLHAERWTNFDDAVGHCRRYEPVELAAVIEGLGLRVERSAAYGMQPRESWLLDLGLKYLSRHPRRAMWWYNHAFMPIGLRLQKPLRMVDGFIATQGVDEVLLVCRRLR
ncbi:MAG TPA: class I SAM-dependent methyltransferase [Nevskiaceae bacterium]